jgi:hypothetical protein
MRAQTRARSDLIDGQVGIHAGNPRS